LCHPVLREVFPGVAQPAQLLHMRVAYASLKQRLRQSIAIELWIVPGTRDRPHIYQSLYSEP